MRCRPRESVIGCEDTTFFSTNQRKAGVFLSKDIVLRVFSPSQNEWIYCGRESVGGEITVEKEKNIRKCLADWRKGITFVAEILPIIQ